MKTNFVSQIPKNLLFKFRIPCRKFDGGWKQNLVLTEKYRLSGFGALEDRPEFADVRAAWSEDGLFFTIIIDSKKQSVWCRDTQILESDGFQFWVDTRCTQNIHRASRFCHWFTALPGGNGPSKKKPLMSMHRINRAKEDSPTLNRGTASIASKINKTGYQLSLFVSSSCLNGWNSEESRQLGFNYAVVDRELGWQTLGIGPELPISEDPSLWQVLQLVE